MKKINLRGLSNVLHDAQLKNVMGGSGGWGSCRGSGQSSCSGECGSVDFPWGLQTYYCEWTTELTDDGSGACICV